MYQDHDVRYLIMHGHFSYFYILEQWFSTLLTSS